MVSYETTLVWNDGLTIVSLSQYKFLYSVYDVHISFYVTFQTVMWLLGKANSQFFFLVGCMILCVYIDKDLIIFIRHPDHLLRVWEIHIHVHIYTNIQNYRIKHCRPIQCTFYLGGGGGQQRVGSQSEFTRVHQNFRILQFFLNFFLQPISEYTNMAFTIINPHTTKSRNLDQTSSLPFFKFRHWIYKNGDLNLEIA